MTNPNAWVVGEPGQGKSALLKSLLWRMGAIYGPRRWVAVADPKGEYSPIAEHLELMVLKLTPGGTVRLNPLAPGPASRGESRERQVLRQAELLAALVATVLDRPLSQVEDAVLFGAVEHLVEAPSVAEPTLVDVAAVLAEPPEPVLTRVRQDPSRLADDVAPVAYALDKLLRRSLRGMFDGESTITSSWDGPGLVLDLSAVPLNSDALPLVMVAAAGWLQQLMATPGPRRVQVLDEAWALLANRHTAAYLQSCWKLGRTYGTANIGITHRVSDLVAQADDGTATAKIAAGLLADSATKIVLRQAPDQHDRAVQAFGLTEPEAQVVGQLARGRALWKIGGRTAVVQHLLAPSELFLVDTDQCMRQ